MDGPPDSPLRNPVIGIIGRADPSARERTDLARIGRLIVALGRKVALIPAPGVAEAVREGVDSEGGETIELESDVIGRSDHTFVFPDRRLLARLSTKHPDLDKLPNVTVVFDTAELVEALETVATEKNIALPR